MVVVAFSLAISGRTITERENESQSFSKKDLQKL